MEAFKSKFLNLFDMRLLFYFSSTYNFFVDYGFSWLLLWLATVDEYTFPAQFRNKLFLNTDSQCPVFIERGMDRAWQTGSILY